MAWARDARSFEALRGLLGREFDAARHRLGVDVAFGLEAYAPRHPVPERLASWLGKRDFPLVGLNVSGLVYNNPEYARSQLGHRADYRSVLTILLHRLLERTNCRIVLIPHVFPADGPQESDVIASEALVQLLKTEVRERILVLPTQYDQHEVKWLVGQTDWFCGTRMHSTIAALSSGVPTAAIAYSLKTAGVFETCGQSNQVADLRETESEQIVEEIWNSFRERDKARLSLASQLPTVRAQAARQMDEIMQAVEKAPLKR